MVPSVVASSAADVTTIALLRRDSVAPDGEHSLARSTIFKTDVNPTDRPERTRSVSRAVPIEVPRRHRCLAALGGSEH